MAMQQPQTTMTENPAAGVPGMLYDMNNYASESVVNAESSAAIAPGLFVVNGTGVDDAKLPTAAADITAGKARGFAIFQDLNINPSLLTNADRAKYQPKQYFPITSRCEGMWVYCPKAWTKNGKVFIRYTASLAYPLAVIGQVHPDVDNSDDGSGAVDHCVALVSARFLDTGAAAGLALIKFDVQPTG